MELELSETRRLWVSFHVERRTEKRKSSQELLYIPSSGDPLTDVKMLVHDWLPGWMEKIRVGEDREERGGKRGKSQL